MKRIIYVISTLLLLASCSNTETVPPATDWTPAISRSATGGQDLRIVGQQGNTPLFNKILTPAPDGAGKAEWKDGKPVWNNETLDLIAFAPAGSGLPATVEHNGTTEYFLDYHPGVTKVQAPSSFHMHPLMAQLKVHIWVEETEVHTPENDSVYVYTKADIDFPEKKLKNPAGRDHVCLGSLSQSGTLEQDGHHFDKFSMDRPLVVIPQTIPAGEEVLWFSIEDAHYYFKPDFSIDLKPGYLTSLTLHVIYVDEEGDTVEPPVKKVIAVDKHTVTITPWEVGETTESDIYNPDNN